MTWKEAIIKVLAEEKRAMHYKNEITKMILDRGYKTDDRNETPESLVNKILNDEENAHLFRCKRLATYELIGTSAPAPHSHKIDTESLAADTTVGRVAPVVRPSSSYSLGDSRYKRASDFVDSPVLSKLEIDLLELIVNFRLPLVDEDVCFADILDRLEVEILEEEGSRRQSIDTATLRQKLSKLNEHIEKIQSNPQLGNLDGALLERMLLVAGKARQRLDGAFGDKVEFPSTIFGEFVPESKPKVVIYLKSIEKHVGYESRWKVMAAVFVHEMFHAWNYFNAGPGSVLAIDEPMVEFETLYFLKKLEDFTSSQSHCLKDKLKEVRKEGESLVQNKQQAIGDVAAYGFGYYLFKELSESDVDSIQWIETYSKKSASIKSSKLVKKVEKTLIPVYPFGSEDEVMEWFKNIIFDGQVTSKTVEKSAIAKVGLGVSLRDLVLACIEIIGRKCFDAQEIYAFAPIFKVCVPECKDLKNTLKLQLDELVRDGILDALPGDCYSILASIEVKPMPPASTPPPTLAPAPTKSKGGYTRKRSIPFAVKFPDYEFYEKTATETFIKSLQYIGLSKVQSVGIMYQGYNLVSDVERPRDGKNKWQDYVDGKYIYTKLGNPEKIDCLNRIATKLGISIKIYYPEI